MRQFLIVGAENNLLYGLKSSEIVCCHYVIRTRPRATQSSRSIWSNTSKRSTLICKSLEAMVSMVIGVCSIFFNHIVLCQTLNIHTRTYVCCHVTLVFCCCCFLNSTLLYRILNSLSSQSALTWTIDTSHHHQTHNHKLAAAAACDRKKTKQTVLSFYF